MHAGLVAVVEEDSIHHIVEAMSPYMALLPRQALQSAPLAWTTLDFAGLVWSKVGLNAVRVAVHSLS